MDKGLRHRVAYRARALLGKMKLLSAGIGAPILGRNVVAGFTRSGALPLCSTLRVQHYPISVDGGTDRTSRHPQPWRVVDPRPLETDGLAARDRLS